ncbi:uncharacterized protein I303_101387 [Kwoniella dejecticola CBS 10117]|uniref:Uncharacterized protein n=1 Tax=Kwoniella dejecticola CBS 10117 TaxID=1296121 RepID=A0A1A6AHS7_9TREE|nr:uncharacterized protein I303_01396 [Kwoniella dejecticola CBS 10117]OBR89568.1 hypothetical protein I303_01396 [Kwoniella dejecticola CBS 10117]
MSELPNWGQNTQGTLEARGAAASRSGSRRWTQRLRLPQTSDRTKLEAAAAVTGASIIIGVSAWCSSKISDYEYQAIANEAVVEAVKARSASLQSGYDDLSSAYKSWTEICELATVTVTATETDSGSATGTAPSMKVVLDADGAATLGMPSQQHDIFVTINPTQNASAS